MADSSVILCKFVVRLRVEAQMPMMTNEQERERGQSAIIDKRLAMFESGEHGEPNVEKC